MLSARSEHAPSRFATSFIRFNFPVHHMLLRPSLRSIGQRDSGQATVTQLTITHTVFVGSLFPFTSRIGPINSASRYLGSIVGGFKRGSGPRSLYVLDPNTPLLSTFFRNQISTRAVPRFVTTSYVNLPIVPATHDQARLLPLRSCSRARTLGHPLKVTLFCRSLHRESGPTPTHPRQSSSFGNHLHHCCPCPRLPGTSPPALQAPLP
ncbi:hypothetical protein OF83DRAFT_690400 [Amylostereum chailletii]|nr:hypothetical protein OF83DRAFT_690400 [Amylostereum chailletii]